VELSYDLDDAGDNEIVYTNNPSDISDTLGRPLAAFEMGI
jgi:hypothetical protein